LGRVDPIEFAETLIASLDESGGKSAIIIDEIVDRRAKGTLLRG
jgi:hypothetical protein